MATETIYDDSEVKLTGDEGWTSRVFRRAGGVLSIEALEASITSDTLTLTLNTEKLYKVRIEMEFRSVATGAIAPAATISIGSRAYRAEGMASNAAANEFVQNLKAVRTLYMEGGQGIEAAIAIVLDGDAVAGKASLLIEIAEVRT